MVGQRPDAKDVLPDLTDEASNPKLKAMMGKSSAGITKHIDVLKALINANGRKAAKDHCKAMEGLVKEAKKHALDSDLDDGDVRDVIIISQYQRVSHYGLAGFGAAAAYAKALGLSDDEAKLHAAVLRDPSSRQRGEPLGRKRCQPRGETRLIMQETRTRVRRLS